MRYARHILGRLRHNKSKIDVTYLRLKELTLFKIIVYLFSICDIIFVYFLTVFGQFASSPNLEVAK